MQPQCSITAMCSCRRPIDPRSAHDSGDTRNAPGPSLDRAARDHSILDSICRWWDRLFDTYRAQPAAGQAGMTIGIDLFRRVEDLRLDRMLIQPLIRGRGTVSDQSARLPDQVLYRRPGPGQRTKRGCRRQRQGHSAHPEGEYSRTLPAQARPARRRATSQNSQPTRRRSASWLVIRGLINQQDDSAHHKQAVHHPPGRLRVMAAT